ncbi:MAG: formylglycine-generating enzyme family protein [Kiritimatiellaeota bacterium]|nr:formylglycine-generating enzyme family protein [Kiritimatiellota bacterium]
MTAVAAEFPDIILYSTTWLSATAYATDLESHAYGLLPSFVDGMLDVITPKTRLIDARINNYRASELIHYAGGGYAVKHIDTPALQKISPENRQKYLRQIEYGPSVYVDSHANGVGAIANHTPLDMFCRALTSARASTDEYVWLYPEQGWWFFPDAKGELDKWEDKMPGINEAITLLKNREINVGAKKIMGEMRAGYTPENIENHNVLRNPNFDTSVVYWGYVWDNGTMKVTGNTTNGLQVVQGNIRPNVIGGVYYYFSVDCKVQGEGTPQVFFHKFEGAGTVASRTHQFTSTPAFIDNRPLEPGWMRSEGVQYIPPGQTSGFAFYLQFFGRKSSSDTVWFDNAVLIPLLEKPPTESWSGVDHTLKINLVSGVAEKLPPNFDVTTDPDAKNTNFYLRRITSGGGKIGDERKPSEMLHVTFSDYYMGVFPVTQGQYTQVMGGSTSTPNRPQVNIAYEALRGAAGGDSSSNMVSNADGCFLERLQHIVNTANPGSGIVFDLPSEAQWEFACRAGTTGSFNNTNAVLEVDTGFDAAWTNTINEVAWWAGNNSPSGAKDVGQKRPNNAGLYDMHGNQYEVCRDYFWPELLNGRDPLRTEPYSSGAYGTYRASRSGYFSYGASYTRTSYRGSLIYTTAYGSVCFRICGKGEVVPVSP